MNKIIIFIICLGIFICGQYQLADTEWDRLKYTKDKQGVGNKNDKKEKTHL